MAHWSARVDKKKLNETDPEASVETNQTIVWEYFLAAIGVQLTMMGLALWGIYQTYILFYIHILYICVYLHLKK